MCTQRERAFSSPVHKAVTELQNNHMLPAMSQSCPFVGGTQSHGIWPKGYAIDDCFHSYSHYNMFTIIVTFIDISWRPFIIALQQYQHVMDAAMFSF